MSALAEGQIVNVRLGADPAHLTALHVRIGGGRHGGEGGHIRGTISAFDEGTCTHTFEPDGNTAWKITS